jgi:hypothetical protein
VGVSVALILTLLELYMRLGGATPTAQDSRDLWSRQRLRIEGNRPQMVALLGDSRMESGLVPELLRNLAPGAETVQLAVSGTSCLATLEDLAESNFNGVVIAGVTYQSLTGPSDGAGSQKPWVDHFHASRRRGRLDAALNLWTKMRIQTSLCCLSHNPERIAVPAFERRPDRSMPMYYRTRSTPSELARRHRKIMEDKRLAPATPRTHAPEAALAPARRLVASIQGRGGEVIFVRFPSSGPLYRYEQSWYPRTTTWDRIAAATGAETVFFSDLPPGDWPCPDLSHLDWDQAAEFTEALIAELRRRRGLDRFFGVPTPGRATATSVDFEVP